MSIIILHGDNQIVSRNRLSQLKEGFEKNGSSVVLLDGKTATFGQINLESNTTSLLGEERAVVIEEFFANKKTLKNLTSYFTNGNVVFWEPRELSKIILGSFPKSWKIESFFVPQVVFKFLDMLLPGKPQSALRILHNMDQNNAFSIIPLVSWHIRYLIWAQEDPQTLNLPSWRKQKLTYQASKFKVEKLYTLHEQLMNLDRSVKTGTNILPPMASLELLIANL